MSGELPACKRRRGPYKQYMISSVEVPRQTSHNRSHTVTKPGIKSILSDQYATSATVSPDNCGNLILEENPCQHHASDSFDIRDADAQSMQTDDEQSATEIETSTTDSDEDTTTEQSASTENSYTSQNFQSTENWDKPLYRNARITLGEAVLLVMAFTLTTGLTQSGCSELLQLLSLLLPAETLMPTTKYLLKKYFTFQPDTVVTCFYCPDCSGTLTSTFWCSICNVVHEVKMLNKNQNYFLYLPMLPQLLNLLETKGFGSKLRSTSAARSQGGYSDICDGKHYARVMNGLLLKDCNSLSLTFNTDGVPLFKSSSVSIWPLQSFVNELPASERKTNFLLSGLWFGNGKPSLATFLKPYTDELQHLGSVGFEWLKNGVRVRSRVFAVACCCDSVARAMLQNIMQFNGMFGCSWCLCPGDSVKKGRGSVRIFKSVHDLIVRDDSTLRDCARRAHTEGKPVSGVKGPSPLSLLPGFDMVTGFVVDYMHCVDLGVTRQLSHLWFDSANHDKPWYIGKRISEIDEKLLCVLPPANISRAPRLLSTRAFWKANEWRAFLLFYAPIVLKGILPAVFYEHLILLSTVMYTLQCENISHLDVFYSSTHLTTFVGSFADLYGVEHMSYNVHLLLHLTDCVRNWGPLWCYSAYSFESANGLFLKLFNGTQAVPKQIVSSFSLLQRIQEIIPFTINVETNELVLRLLGHLPNSPKGKRSGVVLLGTYSNRCITVAEKLSIELLLGQSISMTARSYMKAIVDSQIYHSNQYTRSAKRLNCTVLLKDMSVAVIIDIVYVTGLLSDDFFEVFLVKPIEIDVESSLLSRNGENCFHVQIVKSVINTVRAVKSTDLSSKCVVHTGNGHIYAVAQLPNNLEKD